MPKPGAIGLAGLVILATQSWRSPFVDDVSVVAGGIDLSMLTKSASSNMPADRQAGAGFGP